MATIATFLRIGESLHEVAQGEQARWVRVEGDLTSSSATVAAARLLRSTCGTTRRLIVDAAAVEDVDSKFIAVLVELRRRTRAGGAQLVILPSPAVRRWLNICRLEILLR